MSKSSGSGRALNSEPIPGLKNPFQGFPPSNHVEGGDRNSISKVVFVSRGWYLYCHLCVILPWLLFLLLNAPLIRNRAMLSGDFIKTMGKGLSPKAFSPEH